MTRRVALAALPLALTALVAACVAQDAEPPAASTPGARGAPLPTAGSVTAAPTPDRTTADETLLRQAVCWYEDPARAGSCVPADQSALYAIAQMGQRPALVPALVDMLAVDVGWCSAVTQALQLAKGERFEDPYDWQIWVALRRPPRMARGYPEWKARLLALTESAGQAVTFADLIGDGRYDAETANLVWTGVQPNAVPPLSAPPAVHRLAQRYLDPADVVFGLVVNGEARAYPRRIVAWHGVVNDTLGGVPLVLAHCLPCGGAAAFDRAGADGVVRVFGNAGLAWDGRTLLFDEGDLELWIGATGEPFNTYEEQQGDAVRRQLLDPLLMETTTWADWSARHPNTTVLALDTGFVRDYSAGAAFAAVSTSERPLYPSLFGLAGEVDPLPAKELVAAVRIGDASRVYVAADVHARGVVHDSIGGTPVVLLSHGAGNAIVAYRAEGLTIAGLEGSGLDLRARDAEEGRWFVQAGALVSTLDGREHPALVVREGYWWSFASPASELWEASP